MIDFHCHILPGMDDGSKSVEMSRAMLKKQQEQGVDAVIATPHFYGMHDDPERFLQRRQEAVAALGQTEIPVICGAEVAYFDGIGRCAELAKMKIEGTNLLLLEMPFEPWTDRVLDDALGLMAVTGSKLVLAHVERYPKQMRKYAFELLEQGALFQCNGAAFTSLSARRWALELLNRGLIRFLGSDCHNDTTRPPDLGAAAKVIRQKLGEHPILTEQL